MKLKIVLILLLLFCLYSCKKKVENGNRDFIGYWTCFDYIPDYYIYIKIDNNSNGSYLEYKGPGSEATINGTARANSNKLKIGDIYHFNIIDPPHIIDTTNSNIGVYIDDHSYINKKANWEMKLSQAYPAFYHKGNMTFYKADY